MAEKNTTNTSNTKDDMVFSSNDFEKIENEFQTTLDLLAGDQGLELFKAEYERQHQALKKSHENEKKLIAKCRELSQEMIANAAKVHTALKLAAEDRSNLALLKTEIEKYHTLVRQSKEKEESSRELIKTLQKEIGELTKLMKDSSGLSIDRDSVSQLEKTKDEMKDLITKQEKTIHESSEEILCLKEKITTLEHEITEKDTISLQLKENLEKSQKETVQEINSKLRNKKKLDEFFKENEKYKKEINSIVEERDMFLKDNESLKKSLNEQICAIDSIKSHNFTLEASYDNALIKYNELEKEKAKLSESQSHINQTIQKKDDEIQKLIEKIKILYHEKTKIKEEKIHSDEKKKEVEKQKDALNKEINILKKDLMNQVRLTNSDAKIVTELQNQLSRLDNQLRESKHNTQLQSENLDSIEEVKRNLRDEIELRKQEENRLRKLVHELEQSKEKAFNNSEQIQIKYLENEEKLQQAHFELNENRKNLEIEKTKFIKQQDLTEHIRGDLTSFKKNYNQSRDEISEMRRKFKIMNQQIKQLTEDFHSKDNALILQDKNNEKLQNEKQQILKINDQFVAEIKKKQQYITNLEEEINNYRKTQYLIDQEKKTQGKNYDNLKNERDILILQVKRRNDELALLYNKVKVLDSAMNMLQQRCSEIENHNKDLVKKSKKSETELQLRKQQTNNTDNLKHFIYGLQRELLQERIKVKALSEELENPMNVHRYRQLEGTNPKAHEMLQKIQTLQKRLIKKTEEVVEKNLLLQEKEKLYQELKLILARQPGPEVSEKVILYEQNLKEKTKQMKCLTSELNMLQAKVNEYKYQIERLTRDLADVKKKYFEQKKKEQIRRENERPLELDPNIKQQELFLSSSHKQFLGGGFSVNNNRSKLQSN